LRIQGLDGLVDEFDYDSSKRVEFCEPFEMDQSKQRWLVPLHGHGN
jgi:hypothetical protein